jgi:hypothetical protein
VKFSLFGKNHTDSKCFDSRDTDSKCFDSRGKYFLSNLFN